MHITPALRPIAHSPLRARHQRGVTLIAPPPWAPKPAPNATARQSPSPKPPDSRQAGALTHPEIRTIVLGIMLAMFLGALDQTIVATALPTIGRHFRRSWRLILGGHRLPAHRHGGDAALRQAVRHPRPARHDADRHRALRRRFARLRAGAEHDRADLGARAAGHGRRRADGAVADHHRRHRLAARARPLSGLYRGGVCDLLGGRAGAGRLPHPAYRLVADLLDQPAARGCRAGDDLQRAQARAVSPAQAPARPDRRGHHDGGGGGAAAGAVLGRAQVRLDLGARPARCF